MVGDFGICVHCKGNKVSKRRTGKYKGHCQKCWHKLRNKEFQQYRRDYIKNRLKNDPEFRFKQQQYRKKYAQSEYGKKLIFERKQKRKLGPGGIKDRKRQKEYYYENREARISNTRNWEVKNPEKYKERQRKYNRLQEEKIKKDPKLLFVKRMRGAVRHAFKKRGMIKSGHTFELLGYSPSDLNNHLSLYLDKPCEICKCKIIKLDNSHIDHIKPISLAKTQNDVINYNQLENLRLVCKTCNLRKNDSYE